MLSKLLIANRGEIAVRIARTAQKLGIETVSVFTPNDKASHHPTQTDSSVQIEDYLNYSTIIDGAKKHGVDAIHPGYGFLSENADFAEACHAANIRFVGPSASAIRSMGSKSLSKDIMTKAGVQCTPGFHAEIVTDEELFNAARDIGYPVMLKAVMGGGGKGMRIVESEAEFHQKLNSCKQESKNSFGDDRILVEKYVVNPRHIEFQIFGDTHGNVVHLFERDCSVQRRHQKVLEESPAPHFSEKLRQEMAAQAILAGKAVGYVGAGTVEFMLDCHTNEFYFMEMNTRLQVEHPVTELVTGQDLVEWQLRVASGQPLPLGQDDIKQQGHAIEARIYAEDPANNFMPSPGLCQTLSFPKNVRVDSGFVKGDRISPHYDPMIAKLIANGPSRTSSLNNLVDALQATQIKGPGLKTNVDFLANLARTPAFTDGQVHTGFLEEHSVSPIPDFTDDDYAWAAFSLLQTKKQQKPSMTLRGFGHNQPVRFSKDTTVIVSDQEIRVNSRRYQVVNNDRLLSDDGKLIASGPSIEPFEERFSNQDSGNNAGGAAPMPGTVKTVHVAVGDQVAEGDLLVSMVSMKMELAVQAERSGVVEKVLVDQEQFVEAGTMMVQLE
jgi:3-methylcrotonyl-CoA carboxylase alpha subunit